MFSAVVWENFVTSVLLFLPRLGSSAIHFVLFWLAAIASQKTVRRVCDAREIDPTLTKLIGRAAKVTLVLLGLVTALGTLGIDVTALVAGLGLTGFALGFALKDIISNALSGILIIIHKPFARHDLITVAAFTGTVVEIDLRYTLLDCEGRKVFIPNATLFTNGIVVGKREESHEPSEG
jgi:small conductance mechanosensitive channel